MTKPSGVTWEPGHHPGGAPTDYRPEYCEQVVQAALDGFSLTGFAGMVGVARQTISEWCAVHPEFAAACARAKATRCLSWEKRGIKVGDGIVQGGAGPMVQFALKNFAREEYTADRPQVSVNGEPAAEPDSDAANSNVSINIHFDGQ